MRLCIAIIYQYLGCIVQQHVGHAHAVVITIYTAESLKLKSKLP